MLLASFKPNLAKKIIVMALELSIWLIVAVAGLLGYVLGVYFRTPHFFLIGCVLLMGAGALLWGSDGLLVGRELVGISNAGVLSYTDVAITMENVGLQMLALVLVAIGIVSALVVDFGGQVSPKKSIYHF